MIRWHQIDPVLKDAPVAPASHPWRVTRYRAHQYWGYRIGPVYGAFFRWYWQANMVSWIYHHLFGWSCNTWIRNAATKAAEEAPHGIGQR